MTAIAGILRHQEQFPKAVDFIQNILKLDPSNGEVWGSLGHCYLMMDDLQQAYAAYQQALYHLRDPKVCVCPNSLLQWPGLTETPGTSALVWHWYSLR